MDRAQRERLIGELGSDQRHRSGRQVGQLAGQHLEGRHPERVQIDRRILVDAAADLLGRHIRRRSHHRAGGGDPILAARLPREPEVAQLDHVGPARGLDQHDVARVEIAVHHVLGVRGGERAAQLDQDPGHPIPRHRARLADGLRQHPAPQPLHHQIVKVERVVVTEVEDGDDVLVVQLAGDACRAQEALRLGGVGGQLLPEHLERHRPVE